MIKNIPNNQIKTIEINIKETEYKDNDFNIIETESKNNKLNIKDNESKESNLNIKYEENKKAHEIIDILNSKTNQEPKILGVFNGKQINQNLIISEVDPKEYLNKEHFEKEFKLSSSKVNNLKPISKLNLISTNEFKPS